MSKRSEPENPWDRRREESDPAWEAFVLYRTMSPGERSQRRVADKVGKNENLIGRWSSRHDWVNRCFEWDKHVDYQTRTAEIEAVKEMRKRHINMAGGFFAVVGVELNKLLRIVREASDLVLTPDQLQRLGEFATRLERLNHNEPDNIFEQRSTVTLDDRREFIQKVLKDDDFLNQLERLEEQFLPKLEEEVN